MNGILYEVTVFKYGLALQIHIGQFTEQTQLADSAAAHIPEYGFGPVVEEMKVRMVGIQCHVKVLGLWYEISVETGRRDTFVVHGSLYLNLMGGAVPIAVGFKKTVV